ncbi:MAG: NUDIX domain-containing protein [Thermoflexales bacterium]|nr:NUDIX domain-containing protein [Thermoflexales bacterium]
MTRDFSKHWDVGVTGAVVREGKVLYVQRNYDPHKGTWTLPGGYAEHTETLDEAVIRELREETNIEARVLGVVGVRSRWGEAGGGVLVIFRCALVSGEPQADDYEISAAEFFDAEQIAALSPVFPLSREIGLRVLQSDDVGLIETDIPPTSSAQWKAFCV